jgi:hypothetical protein
MPASISLLAIAIMTMPLLVRAMDMVSIEGTTRSESWPIYVKIVD